MTPEERKWYEELRAFRATQSEWPEYVELLPFVPEHTCAGLACYVAHRVPPGDFLYAVLSNDLERAFAKADEQNRAAMFAIISAVYNRLPMDCWGSVATVQAWIEGGKLSRQEVSAMPTGR